MNGFAAFLTAAHQRRNPEAIPHRVQDGAGATKRPKFQPGPAWAARYRLDAAAEGRRLGDLLTAACRGRQRAAQRLAGAYHCGDGRTYLQKRHAGAGRIMMPDTKRAETTARLPVLERAPQIRQTWRGQGRGAQHHADRNGQDAGVGRRAARCGKPTGHPRGGRGIPARKERTTMNDFDDYHRDHQGRDPAKGPGFALTLIFGLALCTIVVGAGLTIWRIVG
jgi:hypothetical protein